MLLNRAFPKKFIKYFQIHRPLVRGIELRIPRATPASSLGRQIAKLELRRPKHKIWLAKNCWKIRHFTSFSGAIPKKHLASFVHFHEVFDSPLLSQLKNPPSKEDSTVWKWIFHFFLLPGTCQKATYLSQIQIVLTICNDNAAFVLRGLKEQRFLEIKVFHTLYCSTCERSCGAYRITRGSKRLFWSRVLDSLRPQKKKMTRVDTRVNMAVWLLLILEE